MPDFGVTGGARGRESATPAVGAGYGGGMDVIELMTALIGSDQDGGPLPSLTADEAIAISGHFHAEANRGEAAIAAVARKLDVTIACGKGCNGCCHDPVLVRGPEAVDVVAWLALPEQAAAQATFLAQYPTWRTGVGGAPERLAALLRTGPQAEYDAAEQAWRKQAVMCAFNHDGACIIYDVRPMVCRDRHAVGTNEHCQPSSTTPPTRIAFVPMDNLVALSKRVMRAADRAALGASAGHEALCTTVAAALTSKAR